MPVTTLSDDVTFTTTHVKFPSSLPPPIETLPLELLIETFVHCASNDAFAPLTLASVSKFWREVVDLSPRVWQLISLDDEFRSVACSRAQAELWVRRSTPLPFDVELHVENQDLILPLLSPLLPSIDRWRDLTMTGKREESVRLCTPSVTLEPLCRLSIFISDAEQEEAEDEASIPKSTFTPQCTHSVTMSVWMSALPQPNVLTPLRFTMITISDCSQGMHTQPSPILNFLKACPELETFFYTGRAHDNELLTKPLPIVSLPRLRRLTLRNTCSARAILSSIHTPQLTELYLAHLNVEFHLQGEHHEEGDSEDDASDFSQSPSSDHATGMGLRKLIARSNPPIRVLEMDFSDMRTKDFRYLFDRLVTLQDFLIVASDMSDNVINFLRPFPLLSNGQGPWHIRLPFLQRLELYHCQRLSGDAIVGAITARVNFTDNTTDYFTLRDLAIIGCEEFTHRHVQVLSKELGTRLRHD